MATDGDLRVQYPAIPWDEPIPVKVGGQPERLACRFCIARSGLRASDRSMQFDTRREFDDHFQREHGHKFPDAAKR